MLININNLPLVAMDFMNDVHKEDVQIINELNELILIYENNSNEINKKLIDEKYKQWFEHTINHFKGEEIQMQEKNFPPYMFHKGEHDYVLGIMDDVFKKWKETNDIDVLKNYIQNELPQWLENHIQSMDTVTAMFLKTGLSPCGGGH